MALSAGKQSRPLAGGKQDYAPQKGSTTVYGGAIVMLDTSGRALPGATATGNIGVGVALTNRGLPSYVAVSDGDNNIHWEEGIFCLKNSGSDPFLSTTQPGVIAFIEDDETVGITSTGKSPAGLFHHLDADGVWVIMGKQAGAVALVLITAADPAAAHLAGAETFTGAKTFGAGVLASGAVANSFAGGTGTFLTSSGANTLSGDTTVAANKFLKLAAGTGVVDASPSSGTFKTSTGLNTLGGDTVMASGKIFAGGACQAPLSGAGAVNVTTRTSRLTSTGVNDAITLADGTQAGQRKTIVMDVDGGSSLLTPTTPFHFATVTFTAVHDWLELEWIVGSGWMIVGYGGVTIA